MLRSLIDAVARPGGRDRGRGARAVLLAGLVPAALVLAGFFPAAASAYTRGFHVYNLSGHPIKYVGVSGADFESTPGPGDVLEPGVGYHDFEEIYYFGVTTTGIAEYQILGDNGQRMGTFKATMMIWDVSTDATNCQTTLGVCTPDELDFPNSTVTLFDLPGTVHDIPAGQAQAQAAVLKQLCREDNAASCDFTPSSEVPVDSPEHQVGRALINNTDEEQETEVKISDTVGATDSVEIAVKAEAKIFKVVDVSIAAKYGHEWTTEHTFEQSVTVHCPAHTKCWITGIAPMLRDTGDFVLTLANTTWNLRGVYFDSPDPNGSGSYEVDEKPLTARERASLPRAVVQTGTGGNDNLAGTNAKDMIFAKGGNDVVNGARGNDRIFGGPGRDRLRGGRGNDRIFGGGGNDILLGGPGRDRVIGGPGRDNVRR